MSVRDGLIVSLPEQGEPLWMRVADGSRLAG
jgi:general secretion pathway protein L